MLFRSQKLQFSDQLYTLPLSVAGSLINGTSKADNYSGSSGNDTINGLGGNDTLIGNGGNDILNGGTGTDSMNGGEGSDLYIIATTAEHPAAEIHDNGSIGIDEVRFAATAASTLTLYANDTGIETVTIGTGVGASPVSTGTLAINVNASLVANALTISGNDGIN